MEKVKIEKIVPDPENPRKNFDDIKMSSLEKSIKAHGIKNPLIVQKNGDTFLIVDGERRYRTAKKLGLKEVPVFVLESTDPVSRLIEQFHIQEQHEGWTPAEKAGVLIRLCDEMKKPLVEICNILGIPERTARQYFSFAKIQNKELFFANNVPIALAEKINAVVGYAKNLKVENMKEVFSKTDQRKLEKQLIESIKGGAIETSRDFTKLKDTFKSNPKLIDSFMEGANPEELYIKSKAKAAFYLRSAINASGYLRSNIQNYLNRPDVKPSHDDIMYIRGARKAANDFLKLVDSEE